MIRHTVLALFLVYCPVDLSPLVPHDPGPDVVEALRSVAVAAELVNPDYCMSPDFRWEVSATRERLREVAGCPRPSDCRWLPPEKTCWDNHRDAWAVRRGVEQRLGIDLHLREGLERLLEVLDWRIETWRLAGIATGNSAMVHRRQALEELKTRIGPVLWNSWRLPSHIPVHLLEG